MKVHELMSPKFARCRAPESLAEAARRMWENDCDWLAVVDSSGRRLVGALTDRDACMAASRIGRSLREIPISAAMQPEVFAVHAQSDVATALDVMTLRRLRRVPVIDDAGEIVGVLAREAVEVPAGSGRPGSTVRARWVREPRFAIGA